MTGAAVERQAHGRRWSKSTPTLMTGKGRRPVDAKVRRLVRLDGDQQDRRD